jgi:DNA-binding transcriptional regulator YhcF (GntR family)
MTDESVLKGFHLFRDSPVPAFLQLKSQIEYLIVTGGLPSGSKLPSIRSVARTLGLGPATVVRAYRELEQAGLVSATEGVGFFAIGGEEMQSSGVARVRRHATELIADAVNNGVTPDQLLQIFLAQISDLRLSSSTPELVVLGKGASRLQELALLLRHALADLNVEVTSLPIEKLEEDLEGWLPRLTKARHVVCLLFDIQQARQLMSPHGISVVPLLGVLRDDVRDRIIHLPVGTRVGVVASKLDFVDGMVSAIASLNSGVEVFGYAESRDIQRIEELAASSDCIIFGSLSRATVEHVLPPSTEAIEFMYVPDGSSVARLRRLLQASDGRQT